jgi:hypothetical protein
MFFADLGEAPSASRVAENLNRPCHNVAVAVSARAGLSGGASQKATQCCGIDPAVFRQACGALKCAQRGFRLRPDQAVNRTAVKPPAL